MPSLQWNDDALFRISPLVLTALSLCLCSSARANDAEDKALALVKKLGREVTRDEKAPGKPVVVLDLSYKAVTNADLKELAALKNLAARRLGGAKVTDADLKRTRRVREPQVPRLGGGTKVTNAGLKEQAVFKSPTKLLLFSTKVTDAGLKTLRSALPKCEIQPAP